MRTAPPIYKYSGLIAGLGLASLLVGFILLLASETLQLASWMILALGVFLLCTAAVLDFRKVKSAVTGRRGRFSAGSTVMVFVFIGIVVLVNATSIQFNKRFDITELAQFTLTTQTKDVLAKMEMEVTAVCFFSPTDIFGLGLDKFAENLLSEYQNYTNKLKVKVIDPDEHPDEAREYGINEYTQYQTIVFESEIGRRMVTPEEMLISSGGQIAGIEMENPFTSAILEVTGVVQKKVYFITGHEEESTTDSGKYVYAAQALKDQLYKVEVLDLMAYEGVPDDCTVLVLADPKDSLNSFEYDIIRDYIDNDGWMIIFINPGSPDDLKEFISGYWMDVETGIIVDEAAYYSTKDIPIVPRYQNEFGLSETYYPGAASIKPREDYPDDLLLAPLFFTSAASWVEKNFDPTEEPEFNESIEQLGARAIGVLMMVQPSEDELNEDGSLKEGTKYSQLIVVGDSDFASNQHFYNAYNGYQFLYLFEYLSAGQDIIKIERKVLPYRSLILTPEEETFIRVSSIGLLPLLVLVAGVVIWWRRR